MDHPLEFFERIVRISSVTDASTYFVSVIHRNDVFCNSHLNDQKWKQVIERPYETVEKDGTKKVHTLHVDMLKVRKGARLNFALCEQHAAAENSKAKKAPGMALEEFFAKNNYTDFGARGNVGSSGSSGARGKKRAQEAPAEDIATIAMKRSYMKTTLTMKSATPIGRAQLKASVMKASMKIAVMKKQSMKKH